MSQDINRLLASADAGEDLSDTSAFMLVERLMEGVADDESGVPFAVIDRAAWRDAEAKSLELLEKSKDLRLASIACRSWMVLRGLHGLREGLELIRRLLEEYWEEVHPRPYEDEPDNFQDRVNALAALNDYGQTLYYFRDLPLLRIMGGQALTPRMFCLAAGRLQPKTDEEAGWSVDQLRQAINNVDAGDVDNTALALEAILGELRAIGEVFREKAGSDYSIDMKLLGDDVKFLSPFFKVQTQAVPEIPEAAVLLSEGRGGANKVVAPGGGTGGGIESRADVISMLDTLCDFMERTEPAHPAPLFMRRAQRLLSMSFMEIIEDLTPDALDVVRNYKGRDGSGDD